jgi:hypothetical protein
MIKKTTTKGISLGLMVFILVLNIFSLHGQGNLDKKFKKIADSYDMAYQVPKDYVGIKVDYRYNPNKDFLQSELYHSIKCKRCAVAVAFALISTKPDDTPRGKRIREVLGNPDRINLGSINVEIDTTLSKMKYLDTLQLKKVNANRGVVYNLKVNNKYDGVYSLCKKIILHKDHVARAEILFFYSKGDETLVDEEINKTWGMLKFK